MDDKHARQLKRDDLPEDLEVLKDIVLEQARTIAEVREELVKANQSIADLTGQLEQARGEAKRQAAPFRLPENKRKQERKKPGRKKGHPGAHRPKPDHVDEEIEEPLKRCDHCNSQSFVGVKEVEQFIEDIPPVRPHVTRLVTYHGTCAGCGAKVSSTHPLQVSNAIAAAGVHLGPRALAVAAQLNKAHGLTMRKTCAVLENICGLKLTAGGLSQALDRVAKRLETARDQLEEEVRQALFIHIDETSWWVGEPKWWLWVFTNPSVTLYRVVKSRGRQVVYDTLGTDFKGVLVSDCLSIYDDASAIQQKCYAHHLKAISEAIERRGGEAGDFLGPLRALLRAAIPAKAILAGLDETTRGDWRARMEARADRLLAEPRGDPFEERVRQRLVKQRDHLFIFLDHEGVDATNNLAERQLRPAVISRKVSCGNRTKNGARTWEILASLSATCRQRDQSFLDFIASAMPLQAPTAFLPTR